MRAVMWGYWIILVGAVLDIAGSVWDFVDPLTGQQVLGGVLTPEILKFLGISVIVLGLLVGFRLGFRRRQR
jgi:hypothetical protein